MLIQESEEGSAELLPGVNEVPMVSSNPCLSHGTRRRRGL